MVLKRLTFMRNFDLSKHHQSHEVKKRLYGSNRVNYLTYRHHCSSGGDYDDLSFND